MSATRAISVSLVLVFALQFWAGVPASIGSAGLVKPLVAEGQWWRLLTACFLHGNLVHLFANLSVLEAFGRIANERTSSVHLVAVYLAAGLGGSLCSLWLTQVTSIGASGAVLGVVGFCLVIGYREPPDTRHLFKEAGKVLVITGLLGLALYWMIDNAAHLGGALTGVIAGVWFVRGTSVRPLSPVVGGLAAATLAASAVTAGVMTIRDARDRRPAVAQVTDHTPVPEARVTLKIWPGLEGVEYALANVSRRGLTAWEVGFYADNGTRRVGSFSGDVCRPVKERPGWLRPGQSHVESFRRILGESRHGLSARVDLVLVDGAGFSGSRARYDAMLEGRRFRLAELEAIHAALEAAVTLPPEAAERMLRGVIDARAAASEQTRYPLLISELHTARRDAEQHPERLPATLQRLLGETRHAIDSLRRCDPRH